MALYLSSVFVSLPNFWLGIVLALLLSVKLQLLPAIGYRGFAYTILPALVLAIEMAPFIIRTLTVSVAGVMSQSFIDIARVRGLTQRQIVFRHGVKNAAVPLLNLLGVQFSMLLGRARGRVHLRLSRARPADDQRRDAARLSADPGIAIVTAAAFVLINILVDLASTAIDPRLEY